MAQSLKRYTLHGLLAMVALSLWTTKLEEIKKVDQLLKNLF